MLGRKLREFIEHQLVSDVPDEMGACIECNVARCSSHEYDSCPYRLARLGSPKAVPAAEPDLGARS